jgi:hypothetical protein
MQKKVQTTRNQIREVKGGLVLMKLQVFTPAAFV